MHRRRTSALIATIGAAVLAMSACSSAKQDPSASATTQGSSGSSGTKGSTTLRLALSSDVESVDPDTIYQLGGNQITTALYEGLVDYAGDSTSAIVPLLAQKYVVSPDGLTYTFTLRPGLKFSDGTPLDSAAFIAGFDRRGAAAVKSQMGYMLANVASYKAPDPATFVIKLKSPQAPFLTFLASPFSPKAINPTVLAAHKSDDALGFLKDHSAGSGPYELTQSTPGQQYVLTRNASYWGPAPYYEKVVIKVIPDAATQVLQLQGGDLDIVTGQPVATVKTFADNPKFQVTALPSLQKAWLHLKLTDGPTSDPVFRQALRAAIDRPSLVAQVWGDYAAESTQLYPVQNVPAGLAGDTWTYDPGKLKAVASGMTITLGYSPDRPADEQVVETLQSQWTEAGLKVTLVPVQNGDQYGWAKNLASAPDVFYEVAYPDSSHPDSWSRLFWYSDTSQGNGALNYLLGGSKAADAAMDRGVGEVQQAAADAAYGESGDLVVAQASFISLSDPKDTFIARKGITGFSHWLPTPLTLQLKTLAGS